MIAVDSATAGPGSKIQARNWARDCMPARGGDFFFFFGSANPRIFEDTNGSLADPDRSLVSTDSFYPSLHTAAPHSQLQDRCSGVPETRSVRLPTTLKPNKAGVSQYSVTFLAICVGKIMAAARKDCGCSWASRAPLKDDCGPIVARRPRNFFKLRLQLGGGGGGGCFVVC